MAQSVATGPGLWAVMESSGVALAAGLEHLQLGAVFGSTNSSGSVEEVISLKERNINISSGESRNILDCHGVDLALTMPSIISRNSVMKKHCIAKFFQTLNQARTVWDPRCKDKGLFGGHLNIRSMTTKCEQLEHLLVNCNTDFLGLTETWLTRSSPEALTVKPGYDFLGKTEIMGGEVEFYYM